MNGTMKALIATACIVVIATGGMAARDRYKTASCQQTAGDYRRSMLTEVLGPTAHRYFACVDAGWIGTDAWKGK